MCKHDKNLINKFIKIEFKLLYDLIHSKIITACISIISFTFSIVLHTNVYSIYRNMKGRFRGTAVISLLFNLDGV